MHYPPTYTPEQRKKDRSSVGDGLGLMAMEFCALSAPKPQADSAVLFEVGSTGGDVPYLASLSASYVADFLYEATFSRLGAGYVHIKVIRLTPNSPFEILGVSFWLPAADSRSKAALVEITRKQLGRMNVPVTPDLVRRIEESLTPVQYVSPSR